MRPWTRDELLIQAQTAVRHAIDMFEHLCRGEDDQPADDAYGDWLTHACWLIDEIKRQVDRP